LFEEMQIPKYAAQVRERLERLPVASTPTQGNLETSE
jgi:hypothetical protein